MASNLLLCYFCDFRCFGKFVLLKHMWEIHGNDSNFNISCELCGRTYKKWNSLKKRDHAGECVDVELRTMVLVLFKKARTLRLVVVMHTSPCLSHSPSHQYEYIWWARSEMGKHQVSFENDRRTIVNIFRNRYFYSEPGGWCVLSYKRKHWDCFTKYFVKSWKRIYPYCLFYTNNIWWAHNSIPERKILPRKI